MGRSLFGTRRLCKWHLSVGRYGWNTSCLKGEWVTAKNYHARLMMIVKDQESEDEVDALKNVAACEGEDLVSLFAAADDE